MTDSLQAEQEADERDAIIFCERAVISDFISDRIAIVGRTKALELIKDELERFELGME